MITEREFLKKGFLDAVGERSDAWVRLNAHAWYDKGVLTLEDIDEINEKIEAQSEVDADV